nr:ArsA-related P-loop ATPase [Spiractinospora alimapuensis]
MSARGPAPDNSAPRLHVVTGKGGTGKTTVAAAMALSLAARGHRVLLMEVEGRQGIAELFGTPPLPYDERWISGVGDEGSVHALAVDAEQALLEYLDIFYGIRRAAHALTRLGVVDFATTVAPGMRDVLLTGKAVEAVRRRRDPARRSRWSSESDRPVDGDQEFAYDRVVLDGPPTGRIAQFLSVNAEVAGLAKVGPIRNHAERVMRVIRSPQTAVHFVTTLEEMPVQESLDGVAQVRDTGIPVGGLLLNMTREQLLSDAELARAAAGDVDTADLRDALESVDTPQASRAADLLARELVGHARRIGVEKRMRHRLEEVELPVTSLPLLPDGVDPAGLRELAKHLTAVGTP